MDNKELAEAEDKVLSYGGYNFNRIRNNQKSFIEKLRKGEGDRATDLVKMTIQLAAIRLSFLQKKFKSGMKLDAADQYFNFMQSVLTHLNCNTLPKDSSKFSKKSIEKVSKTSIRKRKINRF